MPDDQTYDPDDYDNFDNENVLVCQSGIVHRTMRLLCRAVSGASRR